MTAKYPVTSPYVSMYDSVRAASLPAGCGKYAGYVDGDYESHKEIAARFPAARVFGITIKGAWSAAAILDYEEGNPAYKNRSMVRDFISYRNGGFPQTAVIYCPEKDLGDVEDYAEGLWHVLWVANWGMDGAVGHSLTGTRTEAGNLIVATQVQTNVEANWDMSDTLASWT